MKIDADLLRKLRTAQNMSQEQLSEAAGLSPRTIQRIESSGKASIDSVRALADALEVEPGDLVLIEDSEPMTPIDAIKTALTKFADFNGTATRYEFWWFAVFYTLVAATFAAFSEELSVAVQIVFLLPLLAVGARRLHEIGKSTWWLLFILAPVGGIILLVILWALPPSEKVIDYPVPG